MLSNPPKKKARMIIVTEPDAPATSPIDEKIPDPIVAPTDTAVASQRPSLRERLAVKFASRLANIRDSYNRIIMTIF